MSIGLFIGLAFLTWGPPLILTIFAVLPFPFLFLTFFITMLFGLMSYFWTSILWLAIDPMGDSVTYVFTWLIYAIISELCRVLLHNLYHEYKRFFYAQGDNAVIYPVTDLHFGLSSGLGLGITQQLLFFGAFMVQSAGEGSVFPTGVCEYSLSTAVNGAVMGLCQCMINVSLSIAATPVYKSKTLAKYKMATFSLNTGLQFFLQLLPLVALYSGFCLGVVVVAPLVTVVSAVYAYVVYNKMSTPYERLTEHAHAD